MWILFDKVFEGTYHLGVEMYACLLFDISHHALMIPGRTVGALRREGIEHVNDSEEAGSKGNFGTL